MRHSKKKGSRIVVRSPGAGRAHGRPLPTAPALRTRIAPGDAAERLAFALIERHLHNRGIDTGTSERAIKARLDRAREELRGQEGGADEALHITTGLAANGGALLRSVETAAPDSRAFAARAAIRFVHYVREHKAETTGALVLLASAAQWSALGELLRDRAFAAKADDAKALEQSVKLAATCASASRLDLLGGLQLEREARDAKPAPAWPWMAGAPPPPPDASEDDEAPADEGEDADASTRHAGAAIEADEDDEQPPEDDMAERPPATNPRGLVPSDAARDHWASTKIVEGPTVEIGPDGRMRPKRAAAAPPAPAPRPVPAPAAPANVPPPLPPNVRGKWDPQRGWVSSVDGVARPTPEGLRAMKLQGLDVSRWEREPE
ncbi:MAG: hypothetical protein ACLQVI_22040 [Polyangiaceae bacterium]